MTTLTTNGVFRTPTGLRVKPQSYSKLEAIANELRPSLPLVAGERFKLDCCAIFERSLPAAGYSYRVDEIKDAGDCAGYTIPEQRVVALRLDVYDKLHDGNVFGRSTVVHELSHIAMQHHRTLYRGADLGKTPVFRRLRVASEVRHGSNHDASGGRENLTVAEFVC
jgi:hypothetical protein